MNPVGAAVAVARVAWEAAYPMVEIASAFARMTSGIEFAARLVWNSY